MTLSEYISELDRQYRTGLAREHAYRPALQQLLAELLPKHTATNEPARVACGAPDFIITRKSDALPVAFLEAKDIDDADLDGRKTHREQFDRYKQSLDTIVFTDYLDFHLYVAGEFVSKVRIGETAGGRIRLVKENQDAFFSLIERLAQAHLQPITSASKLAQQMAAKARLLAEAIRRSFDEENKSYANEQLRGEYEAFRNVLIHDITPEAFADIYAQTIAYGMFAARLHDPTPETFSRQEAATLIPRTNPFLRQIFQSIAGYDLDERIAWIVDDLAATFGATNIEKVMRGYTDNERHSDPMIYFYEDFLSAYNPKLRKSKGVWYTPQPVVSFIVRAVDDILKRDFHLPMGLADYSTIQREVKNDLYEKGKKGEKPTLRRTFHKVQILDPATGTGTFLAEVVRNIFGKFRGQEGMWQSYVAEHLLCRLNGFELLMASYAIAHLKLDMLLSETGYVHRTDDRLRVYLTNSLEECHPDTGSLFAQWLSREANEANRIKRDAPVMVMLGNPPYSVSSSNKGVWITRLVADYKKNLNEKNIQPLSDDYIKFIRLGHHYIEKNGEGILTYISNNSFLDGLIHRQMRLSLLQTFSDIYILDLHGNSRKKEICPDGSKDENVFDIMAGVSINIFVRRNDKQKNKLAHIYHYELYGLRQNKYNFLQNTPFDNVQWQELHPQAPEYFFVPKDFSAKAEYEKGIKIDELFLTNANGIMTSKDTVNLWNTETEVEKMVNDLISFSEEDFRKSYNIGSDSRDWSIARAKADIMEAKQKGNFQIIPCNYRPFDRKFIVYTGKTNGIVARPRYRSLRAMLHPQNFGLLLMRTQNSANNTIACFISKDLPDLHLVGHRTFIFPLYAETNVGEADSIFAASGAATPSSPQAGNLSAKNHGNEDVAATIGSAISGDEASPLLIPNFRPEIVKKIKKSLGEEVAPQELFDYIYAVLHSPTYRERYKEFLKIDFPRIPYPTDAVRYHTLSKLGAQLRHLHLMDGAENWQTGVTYPMAGENEVTQPRFAAASNTSDSIDSNDSIERNEQNGDESVAAPCGRVYINETQYFGGVSEAAWKFFIGGYQPAQKWLKDRKARQLSFADIRHYEQIIYALSETIRIMQEIDNIYNN